MSKNKYAISDELWERIQPFIPARENPHPRGGGRKPKDDRVVFDAILFVLRFGCQWNALNATGLCPSSTGHDRFLKWVRAGLFHDLLEQGLLDREPLNSIDWSWLTAGVPSTADATGGRKRGRLAPAWRARRHRELTRSCPPRQPHEAREEREAREPETVEEASEYRQ